MSARHLLFSVLLLAGPPIQGIQAQEPSPSATAEELTALRRALTDGLTPLEARLLERVESLEQRLTRVAPWRDPKVYGPVIAALLGWAFALYQLAATKRQRTWELLLESLSWFEGGTQKRSVGIALVESKWEHQKEFRSRWISILVNQAIYLLTREKDRGARHERANLYRIMNLLTTHHKLLQDVERTLLADTLAEYSLDGPRGLQDISPELLKNWRECFGSKLATAGPSVVDDRIVGSHDDASRNSLRQPD